MFRPPFLVGQPRTYVPCPVIKQTLPETSSVRAATWKNSLLRTCHVAAYAMYCRLHTYINMPDKQTMMETSQAIPKSASLVLRFHSVWCTRRHHSDPWMSISSFLSFTAARHPSRRTARQAPWRCITHGCFARHAIYTFWSTPLIPLTDPFRMWGGIASMVMYGHRNLSLHGIGRVVWGNILPSNCHSMPRQ
jgi:hypothetical protein